MKYQVDQWVIYDPWKGKPELSKPQRAVILYVFPESDRRRFMYDYEIYIDSDPGRYIKARETDLAPYDTKK